MKRIEPLILTIRFLVFDREPYRTKKGTVIRLNLRTANRTNLQRLSIHRTNFGAVPRAVRTRYGSVRFDTVRFDTVRYGSVWFDMVRYGSIRFSPVRYGTVWYGMVRYGSVWFGTVRYGSVRFGTVTNSDALLYNSRRSEYFLENLVEIIQNNGIIQTSKRRL